MYSITSWFTSDFDKLHANYQELTTGSRVRVRVTYDDLYSGIELSFIGIKEGVWQLTR